MRNSRLFRWLVGSFVAWIFYPLFTKLFHTLRPAESIRRLLRQHPTLSLEQKIAWDLHSRPHYAYGVFRAAAESIRLGLKGVTVVEFGVAGGNGLVALEVIAAEVAQKLGIEIKVVGFDTGEGMPREMDYRDLPHVWQAGFFRMDVPKLRARLRQAELVLGNVKETVAEFATRENEPPIGFVAFDLDYYSSTISAFKLFEGATVHYLPRVFCYFDDTIGNEWEHHCEFAGELLAIKEFNEAHLSRKITPIHLLRQKRRLPAAWNDQMYIFQDFQHPLATKYIGSAADQQIPLKS